MSDFTSIGHVAVTDTDLEVSRPWYERLIGAPLVDRPVVFDECDMVTVGS